MSVNKMSHENILKTYARWVYRVVFFWRTLQKLKPAGRYFVIAIILVELSIISSIVFLPLPTLSMEIKILAGLFFTLIILPCGVICAYRAFKEEEASS